MEMLYNTCMILITQQHRLQRTNCEYHLDFSTFNSIRPSLYFPRSCDEDSDRFPRIWFSNRGFLLSSLNAKHAKKFSQGIHLVWVYRIVSHVKYKHILQNYCLSIFWVLISFKVMCTIKKMLTQNDKNTFLMKHQIIIIITLKMSWRDFHFHWEWNNAESGTRARWVGKEYIEWVNKLIGVDLVVANLMRNVSAHLKWFKKQKHYRVFKNVFLSAWSA